MSNGKRKGHIHGTKFCRHTTVTAAARKVAEQANNYPEVHKISLGIICGKGGVNFNMKFTPINGGWMITVIGSRTVQQIHIYTTNSTETRKKLETHFSFKVN